MTPRIWLTSTNTAGEAIAIDVDRIVAVIDIHGANHEGDVCLVHTTDRDYYLAETVAGLLDKITDVYQYMRDLP